MWKIFHKWFGYDYVMVNWGGSDVYQIARVIVTPNNKKFVKLFGDYEFLNDETGTTSVGRNFEYIT